MRIIVIEPKTVIIEQFEELSSFEDCKVDMAENEKDALKLLKESSYDLAILDTSIPHQSKKIILSEIIKEKKGLLLLMSMSNDEVKNKLPSSQLSLKNCLDCISLVLETNGISLHHDNRLAYIENQTFAFTPREFSIFEFLLQNKNRAVGRRAIAEYVWGGQYDHKGSNVIDVHIKNIRKKIGDIEEKLITTVRGAGYMLTVENNKDR